MYVLPLVTQLHQAAPPTDLGATLSAWHLAVARAYKLVVNLLESDLLLLRDTGSGGLQRRLDMVPFDQDILLLSFLCVAARWFVGELLTGFRGFKGLDLYLS